MKTRTITLGGHLTRASLGEALGAVSLEAGSRVALVVDCREMTGYDADARADFVAWNKLHRERLVAIAIVTENRLWWMVISTMALASSQRMAAWATLEDARAWLSTLA